MNPTGSKGYSAAELARPCSAAELWACVGAPLEVQPSPQFIQCVDCTALCSNNLVSLHIVSCTTQSKLLRIALIFKEKLLRVTRTVLWQTREQREKYATQASK